MSYTVVVYRYTNRDLALASRPRTAEARPGGQVSPRGQDFRRDAPTLLCYGAISVYAFWLYAYGPALTLLRTELHFSYTVLGVYSALWSAGAVVTGACFARLARRLPRAPLLWSAAAGAVAAILALAIQAAVIGRALRQLCRPESDNTSARSHVAVAQRAAAFLLAIAAVAMAAARYA